MSKRKDKFAEIKASYTRHEKNLMHRDEYVEQMKESRAMFVLTIIDGLASSIEASLMNIPLVMRSFYQLKSGDLEAEEIKQIQDFFEARGYSFKMEEKEDKLILIVEG